MQAGEAAPLINRATLVVMPSHFEAFGFVAVEAMQMQRPIIASNVGGLREIVSDRETGLLVPPKDPWALCQAMEAILRQPAKAVEMGIEGRKRAIERYSLKENLDRYEELFANLGAFA
jgi:glycosyltransferase involved in cell wall biosynthesis